MTTATPFPRNELNTAVRAQPDIRPPTYGAPQRDAINSVVDNIVQDISAKISELRKTLDAIEQQVLEGAALTKHALQDHVDVCVKVNDEISHMQRVVEDIRALAPK
jgi:hypothetical protein